TRPTAFRQQSGGDHVWPSGLKFQNGDASLRKRKIVIAASQVPQNNVAHDGTFARSVAKLADPSFCFRPQSGQFVYGAATHQSDRKKRCKNAARHEAFGVRVSRGATLEVRFWRATRMSKTQRRHRIPKSLISFPDSTALTVGTISRISLG